MQKVKAKMKMMILTASVLMLSIILLSCGGEIEPTSDTTADVIPDTPADVIIPGVITSPSGDTLSTGPGQAVLIYFWIPLNLELELEQDLIHLSSITGSSILVCPVQADPDSRNLAQTLVNDLGISLTVYLADQEAISSLDTSILPSAVLLSPGGVRTEEVGFGAAARLLAAP